MIATLLLFAALPQSVPSVLPGSGATVLDCAQTPEALGCPGRESARYRLPLSEDVALDRKGDALAQDGRQCGLVGEPICRRPPRKILSAPTGVR